MNFQNISETYANEVNGSCLQGHVNIKYHELVEIFGEPTDGDEYKVQKEWILQFEDGTVATIYDWKWSEEYNGDGQGTHYTMVPEWNIGGFNINAVCNVLAAIKQFGSIEGELAQKQLT